jgi:transposase
MAQQSKAISDELYEQAKNSLKKLGRGGEAGRRLQAILSAKVHGIKTVATIYDITRATLMSWIKNFQEESVAGLSIKAGRGRPCYIPHEIQEDIRQLIKGNPTITLRELKQHIADKYSILISLATAHRIMKKLSFSYIPPRPIHYKSNQIAQEEFKKKSSGENKKRDT